MFDRRLLDLSRLMVVCLALISLTVLYWQTARGDELNPVAFRLTLRDRTAENLPKDAEQAVSRTDQDFMRGVSQAIDLERLPVPVVQRTIDLLRRIRRGSIYDRNKRQLAFDRLAADGTWERFYTEASLAVAAAEYALNLTNINLVGLVQTGIEYTV